MAAPARHQYVRHSMHAVAGRRDQDRREHPIRGVTGRRGCPSRRRISGCPARLAPQVKDGLGRLVTIRLKTDTTNVAPFTPRRSVRTGSGIGIVGALPDHQIEQGLPRIQRRTAFRARRRIRSVVVRHRSWYRHPRPGAPSPSRGRRCTRRARCRASDAGTPAACGDRRRSWVRPRCWRAARRRPRGARTRQAPR